MSVVTEGDVARAVADQPGEPSADRGRLKCSAVPFLVDELRGVEPRTLLRLEADVGPRLVRVAGQQQTFGDAKS
ncbi:MAG TPA: hypothetical protein VFS23_31070 [Vicinamibacterales bacterium]|nr:hypothetical protein [Vicinamibacterales bacterium]